MIRVRSLIKFSGYTIKEVQQVFEINDANIEAKIEYHTDALTP